MRLIKRFFTFILLVVFTITGLIVASGWGKYKQALTELPLETAVDNIRKQDNFTEFSDISLTFVNAMVAVEDKRFYKHKGVDVIGIARAFKNNISKKELSEGGSCITQQLAKNLYFINDNTLTRKVAEIFMALNIERNYSKKEILELYFNVIYYGSGYYNIAEASKGYFNKTPITLSDYEATLLAGIPNAPSVYSLNKNPDLAKKRQKTVIEAMKNMKYITEEEAAVILSQQKKTETN